MFIGRFEDYIDPPAELSSSRELVRFFIVKGFIFIVKIAANSFQQFHSPARILTNFQNIDIFQFLQLLFCNGFRFNIFSVAKVKINEIWGCSDNWKEVFSGQTFNRPNVKMSK